MSTLRKNYIYNIIYQLLAVAIPLITTPYLSRILGAEGIGEFSYAYTIVGYFGLFILLGLNNYGNREVAVIRENRKKLSITFWNIYCMQLCCGVAVTIIYLFYYFVFNHNTIILIFSIYLLANMIDINWLFFGLEQFKITVTRNMIIKIFSAICIFAFVKTKEDLFVYAFIIALSQLLSQILLWPFLKKIVDFKRPSFKGMIKHLKPNLILFLPIIGVSLYNMMDKIMLGSITTVKEVGFYESAEKIKNLPIMFISALGTVILPRVSYLTSKKEEKKNRKLLFNSICLVAFITSSICFGTMGVAKEFVLLFFGEEFEKVIYILIVLLPCCIFVGVENVIKTQILIPNKQDKIYITSIFAGAILNLIINFILIPQYGALGAAIATLITEIVVCCYQIICVKKYTHIISYLMKTTPLFLSGITMFFVIYNIKLEGYSSIQVLCCKISIGIVIYVVCNLIFYKIMGNRRTR